MFNWFRRAKSEAGMGMGVKTFFDEPTSTASHVIYDLKTKCCALIDTVLDYDPKSGRTSTASADLLVDFVKQNALNVDWILETHAHADHLSAAPYLKQVLGGKTAIGEHITDVQKIFKSVFNLEGGFRSDGSQFDRLFKDGDTFQIGSLDARVMHTPGHTPACVTYIIGSAAFVGDTLFMPDYGTARCDFPGGDAGTLFQSIQKIFALPDEMRIYLCHDYKSPARRDFVWQSSVADQRANNIHVHTGKSQADFVEMRTARDATLDMPVLMLPSVQVNVRAGDIPPPESNGVSYLKIPINTL